MKYVVYGKSNRRFRFAIFVYIHVAQLKTQNNLILNFKNIECLMACLKERKFAFTLKV